MQPDKNNVDIKVISLRTRDITPADYVLPSETDFRINFTLKGSNSFGRTIIMACVKENFQRCIEEGIRRMNAA